MAVRRDEAWRVRFWTEGLARWDEVDALNAAAYVAPGVPWAWRAESESSDGAENLRTLELLRARAIAGSETALRAVARTLPNGRAAGGRALPSLPGPGSRSGSLPPEVAAAMIGAALAALDASVASEVPPPAPKPPPARLDG